MKLLLISPQMQKPNGGIAVWTDGFLTKSSSLGISCTLVNTEAVGLRAMNGSAHRNFCDEYKRTKRIFKDLAHALKNESFDAVHLNTSCGTFGIIRDYFMAKKIRKAQKNATLALHFHCDIPYQVHNRLAKYYLSKIVKLVDYNLVLCDNSKKYLEKEFAVDSRIIPNFINETYITKQSKTISENIQSAFFVGRVSLAKGASEMYEIARRLPQIQFQLAGVVTETVMSWEKPDNVIHLGPLKHDQVLEYMDQADVFFFPTHSEGFSLALTEAMARGLPVITTNVGANLDMIEDRGGRIVLVGDVDAMENAFTQMQSQAMRTQFSNWCREKVLHNYTTVAVIDQLKKVYTKTI